MSHALLSRAPHRPAPALSLLPDLSLPLGRVHELCGRARRTLALMIAAQAGAPVIWIAPAWGVDTLNPDGMQPYLAPRDVVFVRPERAGDMLWCMEEALRAGTVPVVMADLSDPPAMTPVRRLHLAAETGCGAGLCRPIGLLLTPGTGGAPGIETRLGLEPAHTAGQSAWTLERLRARMAPHKRWQVDAPRDGSGLCQLRPDTRSTPAPVA